MMLNAMAQPLPPPTQRHHQTDTGAGGSPLVLLPANNSSSPSPNATNSSSPSSEASSSSSPTLINSPPNNEEQLNQHNKSSETTSKLQDQCNEDHNRTTAADATTLAQKPKSSLNLHKDDDDRNNECNSMSKQQLQDSPNTTITTTNTKQVMEQATATNNNKPISLQANNHNNTTGGNTYQSRKYNSSYLNHHNNSSYSATSGNISINNSTNNGNNNNNRLNNQRRNSHNNSSHVDQKNSVYHQHHHHHHSYNQQQHNHNLNSHQHHNQQHHFNQQPNHATFGANSNQTTDNLHQQQHSRHHNSHQTNHQQQQQQQQQEFQMPTFNHLSQSETSLPSSDVASITSSVASQRTSNGPPHYVELHVNAGECVSLQLLDGQEQVLTGPATITMISQQQSPPVPIPVQVPPGHMVHQIADENGTLKHIILSIMVNEVDSSQLNSTIINLPHGSFSINDLVDGGTQAVADDRSTLAQVANSTSSTSTIHQLPRQTPTNANHFANYDGCPVADFDATQILDGFVQRNKNNSYLDFNVLGNQASAQPQPYQQQENVSNDKNQADNLDEAVMTTTDKLEDDIVRSKAGSLDVSSSDQRDKNTTSGVDQLCENTNSNHPSPLETHTAASERSQNLSTTTTTTTAKSVIDSNRSNESIPATGEQEHISVIENNEQQANRNHAEVFQAPDNQLLGASVPTSTAYQPVLNTNDLEQTTLMASDTMVPQTVDGQLYGYPQLCCYCYYCDPQQTAAAAANDNQQPPNVASSSIVGQQDMMIKQHDQHHQPTSVAPPIVGSIDPASGASSNRGSINNVSSPNASIMSYHPQTHHSMMNQGSIGMPLGITSGPMMNSQALHPLTGQNGLVPLTSSGHFPEISGSGTGLQKGLKNSRNPSSHYKQHKLHNSPAAHINPRGQSSERRQSGYINHHYHGPSNYTNSINDVSPHYNQDVNHVTPYNKPNQGLLVHPKQPVSATQVSTSGAHNTYPSSPYSSYGHRQTTMANIVSSGGNKSKHHHANPAIGGLTHPQLPTQVYRSSELDNVQVATRNSRLDPNSTTTNHFVPNTNSGFRFQGGDNINNNKRLLQQAGVGSEKASKYSSNVRVLSNSQTLLSSSNVQHQHHNYHNNTGNSNIGSTRSPLKKKGADHQQQVPTKSLHNSSYQDHSAFDHGREDDYPPFVNPNHLGATNSPRNLFINNHEQEKNSTKQQHHISSRTASISPSINNQNRQQQNQKSMNLGKNSDPDILYDTSQAQSHGYESGIKTKGSKQQSRELLKDNQENKISLSDAHSIVDESSNNPRNSRGKQKKSQQQKTSPNKQSNELSASDTQARNSSSDMIKMTTKNQRLKLANESKSNQLPTDEEKTRNKSQPANKHASIADSSVSAAVETRSDKSPDSYKKSAKNKVAEGAHFEQDTITTGKAQHDIEVDLDLKNESRVDLEESNATSSNQPPDSANLDKINHEPITSKNPREEEPNLDNTNKIKLTSSSSSQSLKSESPARKKSKSSSHNSSKTSSPKSITLSVPESKDELLVDSNKSTGDDDVLMISTYHTKDSQEVKLTVEMLASSSDNNSKSLDIISSSEAKSTQTTPQKQLNKFPTDEIQINKPTTIITNHESLLKKRVEPRRKSTVVKVEQQFKLNSLPQVRLLNLNCVSITSNSVCLRWSYIPTLAEKHGINQHLCHGSKPHNALFDHFVVESSSQKNSETNTLVAPKIVYQGCAMTCRIYQLTPEKIYHFRIRRTALIAGGHEEQLAVSEILSVTLPAVQQIQPSASASKKLHSSGPKTSSSNQNDNHPFSVDQTPALANRSNASSHINNTHHQGNKSSSGHQHHHNPIKFSNFVKQCRTKLVSAVGNLVRTSLSSYSDTKFAGLLLVLFTIFAMLLAIFIHLYIVAPVNE